MARRAVITGLGVRSCVGLSVDVFWDALCKGKSGIGTITLFDPVDHGTKIAGEVTDFDPLQQLDSRSAKYMDRYSQFAVCAALDAAAESGAVNPQSGIIIGTAIGGVTTFDTQHAKMALKGPKALRPMDIPMIMCNSAASYVAMQFGCKGQGFSLATACASGTNAIGEAAAYIRDGRADSVICGGSDATINPGMMHAWHRLRITSRRNDAPESACRPFSKDRDGMVLAEGAGMLLVEELEQAKERGAHIYAEIIGYGSSYDATHMTSPDIEGQSLAMERALADAALSPSDIDYISAHGTGTVVNDKTETAAVKKVFGQRAQDVPLSSIKSMLGHSLGAGGAFEAVASCLVLRDGILPPTINLDEPDPECDLDYVPGTARKKQVDTIMSTSFGFGGNNAVLVLRRV